MDGTSTRGLVRDQYYQTQKLTRCSRYLDALNYCKDGNFTLNQHSKKMDELDGALTEGAVYYADTKGHEECKKKAAQKPELNGEVCLSFSVFRLSLSYDFHNEDLYL